MQSLQSERSHSGVTMTTTVDNSIAFNESLNLHKWKLLYEQNKKDFIRFSDDLKGLTSFEHTKDFSFTTGLHLLKF